MDQLLLHFMPDPKQTKREEDRPTEQKVRERLTLFWAGQWPLLITEAEAAPRTAAGMWTDDRLAKRVQDLTDAGEIGRAITLLTAPGTFASTPDHIDEIKRLLHHLPDNGDHPRPPPPYTQYTDKLGTCFGTTIAKTLKTLPRKKAAGPDGSRYEH